METLISEKHLIINASDGEGNTFIVFHYPIDEDNELIFSVEYLVLDESSVAVWPDKESFVKGIGWNNYIYAGITDYGKKYLENYMDIIKKYTEEF